MTEENLRKANSILKEINELKENIRIAEYMCDNTVAVRNSTLDFIGLKDEEALNIPSSLFRKIGMLVMEENNKTLEKLQKQFDEI